MDKDPDERPDPPFREEPDGDWPMTRRELDEFAADEVAIAQMDRELGEDT